MKFELITLLPGLIFLAIFILLIICLFRLLKQDMDAGNKIVWIVILLILPLIGSIIFLVQTGKTKKSVPGTGQTD